MATLESNYNLLATSKLRPALVIRRTVTISSRSPRVSRLLSVTESAALPPLQKRRSNMSVINKFSVREWLVPPVLLPIFFAVLIAAAILIQW
jgi:hypothetical protein